MSNNFAAVLESLLNPTPYFLVLVFLFLAIFIYGINAGRSRMILMLLSIYTAVVLTGLFPYREYLLKNIKIQESYFIELGLFLIAFLAVLILFSNSSLRVLANFRGSILQIIILSILILGVFVSHLTVLLPAEVLAKLDHPIFAYFKTETAQFWWTLAGVAGLVVLKRKGE
jgi:hypothetical protein